MSVVFSLAMSKEAWMNLKFLLEETGTYDSVKDIRTLDRVMNKLDDILGGKTASEAPLKQDLIIEFTQDEYDWTSSQWTKPRGKQFFGKKESRVIAMQIDDAFTLVKKYDNTDLAYPVKV